MNLNAMRRQEKKNWMTTIFNEDPDLVKDWLAEKLADQSSREKMIERMILEDFEEYSEVFKALA